MKDLARAGVYLTVSRGMKRVSAGGGIQPWMQQVQNSCVGAEQREAQQHDVLTDDCDVMFYLFHPAAG